MTERVELRLTDEYQHKLGELVAAYETNALERIKAFKGVMEMPDPEDLKLQIEEAYSSQIEESLSRIERDYEPNGSD